MMVAEDALDRFVLRKLESRTTNSWKLGFYRILMNPTKSFAGVLRGRLPWPPEPPPRKPARGVIKKNSCMAQARRKKALRVGINCDGRENLAEPPQLGGRLASPES